jgi:peptide-methionine (R)-S-oxide reductase
VNIISAETRHAEDPEFNSTSLHPLRIHPKRLACNVMNRAFHFLSLTALTAALIGCQPQNKNVSPVSAMKSNDPVPATATTKNNEEAPKVVKSEEEWRKSLTPEQYRVLREAGTERAFGAAYEEFKKQGAGTYVCGACGAELFSSKEKFDSHCGWPSFYDPANAKNVITRDDYVLGTKRTEVLCARCGGHLGHVFTGEGFKTPTDKRYCINGVSLKFIPAGQEKPKQ